MHEHKKPYSQSYSPIKIWLQVVKLYKLHFALQLVHNATEQQLNDSN